MENTRRIITAGDIHGKDTWKQIDPNKYDKVIFIGDLVDSFDVPSDQMVANLLDIVEFHNSYPDKVVNLLGNHCIMYLLYPHHQCSGFRSEIAGELTAIYRDNRELFQAAYQIDDYLWTHAGVHVGWWKKFQSHFDSELERKGLDKPEGIADQLNMAFELNLECLFDVSRARGGRNDVGGIFWCDKKELEKKPFPNVKQIVGHTPVPEITEIKNVIFIDCLEYGKQEFLEIEL